MSGTFLISPVNILTFKNVNSELPSYDNTLDMNDRYVNSVNDEYFQKFLLTDSIKIKLRTNYDTIVATLYGSNNLPINVPVVLKTAYANYSFYEFVLSGLSEDCYRVVVNGTDDEFAPLEFVCEPFEIGSDFMNKDYLKFEYFNCEFNRSWASFGENPFDISLAILIFFPALTKMV